MQQLSRPCSDGCGLNIPWQWGSSC
jgi:hypothetical protein